MIIQSYLFSAGAIFSPIVFQVSEKIDERKFSKDLLFELLYHTKEEDKENSFLSSLDLTLCDLFPYKAFHAAFGYQFWVLEATNKYFVKLGDIGEFNGFYKLNYDVNFQEYCSEQKSNPLLPAFVTPVYAKICKIKSKDFSLIIFPYIKGETLMEILCRCSYTTENHEDIKEPFYKAGKAIKSVLDFTEKQNHIRCSGDLSPNNIIFGCDRKIYFIDFAELSQEQNHSKIGSVSNFLNLFLAYTHQKIESTYNHGIIRDALSAFKNGFLENSDEIIKKDWERMIHDLKLNKPEFAAIWNKL